MDNVKDFVVDTEGRCFFCLTPSPPNRVSDHDNGPSSPSFNSIHCFSRYLGVDMRKVFREKEAIPSILLSKVERSRLKVELCEDCAVTICKLSTLYEQLEKIEIEMSVHLNHIQKKSVRAKADEMKKSDEFKGKHEIVEVLRTESLQKCSNRLCKSAPWVKVQNFTTAQLNAKMKKKQEATSTVFNAQEVLSNSEQRWSSDTKLEGYNSDQSPMEEEGNDNYSDYGNDEGHFQNGVVDGAPDASFKEGMRRQRHGSIGSSKYQLQSSVTTITPARTSNSNPELENIFLDHKTGKHKCRVCSKEFASKQVARLHHRSIHRKVKYKCRLCGQEFNRKGNYDRHHQSVHIGVRFKCGICNKMFARKGNLSIHQVTAHKKRFSCKFCFETFSSRNILSAHLEGNCAGKN